MKAMVGIDKTAQKAAGQPNGQGPRSIIMVRPAAFFPNQETAEDNAFQATAPVQEAETIAHKAQLEFDQMAATLQARGISVIVFEDTPTPTKPDAVFPNNWFSTHRDGSVVLYPMYAPIRRAERRSDIVTYLQTNYQVTQVIDLSYHETQGQFLEGTGAVVIDHLNHLAYVALSHRAHAKLVTPLCQQLGLKPVMFSTRDSRGIPIYHTNVMMSVGTEFVLICLDCLSNPEERKTLEQHFEQTGKRVIALSLEQLNHFTGNVIELGRADKGPLLALSQTAFTALGKQQLAALEQSVELCPLAVPSIEMGGGSVRCMIAGIHLPGL